MLNKERDEFLGIQDTLKALADPIRREILNLLKNGRLSAGEICEHFSVTGASISRHLAILKEADLIRNKREGKFIYYELNTSVLEDVMLWIIPIITLLYNGIARLVNMGADMENLFMAVIYYGTGLLFMVIGNYLPKVKQNNTIGIRVVWSLMDEENWNATHRFSGKLWMASGILCMLCGLFGKSMAALVVYIISIMAAAIISILYSYLFYKKKLATGEGLKIQYNTKKSVIYLIIAISTIVFTIWTLFCGSIQIRCNDRDFNIEAKGWNDYTGEYSQIDSISYEENVLQNDNDYRTNGFGNLKYAMGNFKNDIFGDYIRYTHASCHSYVVVNIDGKILVVNGENDAETKEIYQRISEKVSKERK